MTEAPAFEMIMNSDTTDCSISDNVFTYTYTPTSGTEAVEGSVAMCYTDTGANFYEPVEIDGVTYEGLVFDSANTCLKTADGKIVINQVYPPLNQLFLLGNWFIKYSALGSYAQRYFNTVKSSLTAIGEELQYAFLGTMLYPQFGFQFISSGYGGALYFAYELTGENQITLQFAMAGGGDGVWYHNNANFAYALYPFGYSSAKTFTLTADDEKKPTQITMTEVGNEVNTITLFAAQIAYPFNN
jgi:hypothetical protein